MNEKIDQKIIAIGKIASLKGRILFLEFVKDGKQYEYVIERDRIIEDLTLEYRVSDYDPNTPKELISVVGVMVPLNLYEKVFLSECFDSAERVQEIIYRENTLDSLVMMPNKI